MPQYVSNLSVVYGNDKQDEPSNCVTEYSGQSCDINKGEHGEFVWIVPVFADPQHPVAGSFRLIITETENITLRDIAKGAGGKYRYLVPDTGSAKAYDLKLLRLGDRIGDLPVEYDARTDDLNDGRGKSFLYLMWKTR